VSIGDLPSRRSVGVLQPKSEIMTDSHMYVPALMSRSAYVSGYLRGAALLEQHEIMTDIHMYVPALMSRS
jgi:hypothetical protein